MSDATTSTDTAAKKATKSKKISKKAEAVQPEQKPFAVIRTGGKQYRVSPGDRIAVEKLTNEAGSTISFEDVLMAGVSGQEGTHVLGGGKKSLGVTVSGKVLGIKKNKKVIIFKKRRRGGYTKKQGHRQQVTEILIESVSV